MADSEARAPSQHSQSGVSPSGNARTHCATRTRQRSHRTRILAILNNETEKVSKISRDKQSLMPAERELPKEVAIKRGRDG